MVYDLSETEGGNLKRLVIQNYQRFATWAYGKLKCATAGHR